MTSMNPAQPAARGRRTLHRDVRDNIDYYLMMLPTLVLIFIFSYLPLLSAAIKSLGPSPKVFLYSSFSQIFLTL